MFTAADLANMRLAHTDRLQDSCYLQNLTATPDGYGDPVRSWADTGLEIDCGLEMKTGSERRDSDKTVVTYDAILRLPVTTTVTELQRVRVTKRHGETITAIAFQIVSPVQRGPSGIRLLLQKVST